MSDFSNTIPSKETLNSEPTINKATFGQQFEFSMETLRSPESIEAPNKSYTSFLEGLVVGLGSILGISSNDVDGALKSVKDGLNNRDGEG